MHPLYYNVLLLYVCPQTHMQGKGTPHYTVIGYLVTLTSKGNHVTKDLSLKPFL